MRVWETSGFEVGCGGILGTREGAPKYLHSIYTTQNVWMSVTRRAGVDKESPLTVN